MKTHRISRPDLRHYYLVGISMLVVMILNMLPLPEWMYWARPEWVLLVLIYWIIALPHHINIGFAWMLGLLVDVMNGTVLGEHALAFTVVAYIVTRLHQRLRMFPLWQQSIAVLLFVLLYQSILFVIQGMIGEMPQTLSYWLPSLASMLFWPWIFVILRDWR